MKLYQSLEGDITLFSDMMVYESEMNGYIHIDDVDDYYMDDNDITIYKEVEPEGFKIFKDWCYSEVLDERDHDSLKLFLKLKNE